MEKEKKWIYYPSFSTGCMANCIKKDKEAVPGIPYRFYNKKMPKEYRHPYFLLTAGHNYKNMHIREKWGLDEEGIKVIGDSGGYQIASGVLKWSNNLRDKIFRWLENNTDVALNIDIPTGYKMSTRGHFSTFRECLETSYSNFKYFNENQTGKTEFINILQGNNENQIRKWYDKVKDFDFNGWALGGSRYLDRLMLKLSILMEKRELEKKNNKYIHILGISKIKDYFILSYLQNLLNELFDNRIQISTDSSTPVILAAFGGYFIGRDYKTGKFKKVTLSNQSDKYISDATLPCNCRVCNNTTYKEIEKFNSQSYGIISMHNFFVFLDTIDKVNNMVESHDEILEQFLDVDFMKILNSFEDILESDDPVRKYKTYLPLYKGKVDIDNMSFDNFFND